MTAPFAAVMADPPWPFRDRLPGKTRGASRHYRLSPMREILAFPLPPIADNALLFLWRVASMPQEALDVAKAWGFEPKSEIVWRKTTAHGRRHMGMGRIVRAEHETCLIATRGKNLTRLHNVRSVFDAPVGVHSAKPEEIYAIIERLVEGPYLSVYDRRERDGWVCLGDEVHKGLPYAGREAL